MKLIDAVVAVTEVARMQRGVDNRPRSRALNGRGGLEVEGAARDVPATHERLLVMT